MLQANAEGYRKEISALRDKVQKYSASVAKHEQTINILRQVGTGFNLTKVRSVVS